MKKLFNKRLLVSAGAAALFSLTVSSQALAGAIGYSYLEIVNLQAYDNDTGNQLHVTDFSFLDIGDSASASSVTSFGPAAASASPGTTDTLLACSGIAASCGAIAENDSSQQVALTRFGRGDTFGNGGALIDGLGGPNFANVWTAAEGRQDGAGFTTSQSGARNSTDFTFSLAGASPRNVRFDFDAMSELFVQLDQNQIQAQASYSWNITIFDIDAGLEIFNWAPDGNLTGSEIADSFSLNDSRGQLNTGSNGTGVQTGFFSNLVTLLAGVNYRFSIGHASQQNTQVPEPAVLLLFGAGLLGLGFSRRQKKA